jgi:hypothetical protein
VQRRQAERFADRDAQIIAERQQAYQQAAPPPQQYAPPPQAPSGGIPIEELKELAELKAQGILTDAEFEAQKAKLLGT